MISPAHRAAGANIKGTPAMRARAVRADLHTLRARADVVMLQEFRWPWYWTVAERVLGARRWSSVPGFRLGRARAVKGAQGIMWDRRAWRRVGSRSWPGFDFEVDTSGIMENRWIRAVLLEDRKTNQRAWFISAHFVVGGDRDGDGPVRRALLADNMRRFGSALDALAKTGHPIIGELDANIGRTSATYRRWARVLADRGATLYGEHGVEYLFAVDGVRVTVEPVKAWTIPTSELNTDHETRGLAFRLIG